ncbi:MAG: hypothetical protein ACOH5I_26270 [Oligoflexus sp.]
MPKSVLEHFSNSGIQFYKAASNHFIVTEPKIRDVCVKCNGGPLSKLDDYMINLIRKDLCNIVDSSYELECDVDAVKRWLLKVSYNSVRAHHGWLKAYEENRWFLLEGAKFKGLLRVYIGIVRPRSLELEEVKKYGFPDGTTHVPPFPFRMGEFIRFEGRVNKIPHRRFLTIGCFGFYLFMWEESPGEKEVSATDGFLKEGFGLEVMDPTPEGKIVFPLSKLNTVTYVSEHLDVYQREYSKLLKM